MTDPRWSRRMLPGGRVVPDRIYRPATGSWRTGLKPVLDRTRCVDCLLCWVYCPDRAMVTADGHLTGLDLTLCKGCEICVAACPVEALTMVPDASGGE